MKSLSLKLCVPLLFFAGLTIFLWQALGRPRDKFVFTDIEKPQAEEISASASLSPPTSASTSVSNMNSTTPFFYIDSSEREAPKRQGTDLYTFDAIAHAALFQKISHELRCVLCQNQSLADSHAPQALKLRHEIYQAIKQGKSESEVLSFITERYGDYILFQPPFRLGTTFLWGGPVFMVLIVFLFFIRQFKK